MSAPSIAGHRNNVPKHPNVLHSYVGTRVSALAHPLPQRAQMSEEDLLSLLWLEMGHCSRRGGESHKSAGGERYTTSVGWRSCMVFAKTVNERPLIVLIWLWYPTASESESESGCWVPESDPNAGVVGSECVSSPWMMQTLMLLIHLPVPETWIQSSTSGTSCIAESTLMCLTADDWCLNPGMGGHSPGDIAVWSGARPDLLSTYRYV